MTNLEVLAEQVSRGPKPVRLWIALMSKASLEKRYSTPANTEGVLWRGPGWFDATVAEGEYAEQTLAFLLVLAIMHRAFHDDGPVTYIGRMRSAPPNTLAFEATDGELLEQGPALVRGMNLLLTTDVPGVPPLGRKIIQVLRALPERAVQDDMPSVPARMYLSTDGNLLHAVANYLQIMAQLAPRGSQ
ncbi:MAG TPA: hypothetical protein VGQ06_02190 [Gemmatimonadales bacterium]|jgi:hypothetical protein|nr:hypothetical protein [Gemmatimonadales bacterium]